MKVLECPKCREETLERTEPVRRKSREGETPPVQPARCTRCHGLWMTRDELARAQAPEEAAALRLPDAGAPRASEEVDRRGGLCPECGRILVRARVWLEPPFFLDRCAHCGGIWFDAGEWQELSESPFVDDLSRLWDFDWRRRRESDRVREAYLARLRDEMGEELWDELNDLVDRLREHDRKGKALAYLQEELGVGPTADAAVPAVAAAGAAGTAGTADDDE